MADERFEVQRTIAADPATIFAVLTDPRGHVQIDSSGMLMSAEGEPAKAVGDTFVVHMDREALNDMPLGKYDVTILITAYERDREIAWTVTGNFDIGHVYGYRLEPIDGGTRHLVLRLVDDRGQLEGARHLPGDLGRRAARDARHPGAYRAAGMSLTAGFIGLGSQGAGMAQRMIELGVPTALWARRAESLEPFRDTAATVASDPQALGHASDVVGICVTDGAAVRDVTLGPHGVLAGMAAGSVLAVHSTIGTDDCTAIADAAAARGVLVIDAPVSGGGAVAAVGQLTVYVGGDDEAVARARPVLETYGNAIFHMGPLGSGLRTKLLNNALNAAHFALAHDAIALGTQLGLDPHRLGDALRSGSGRSFALDVFVGLGSFAAIADMVGPIMAKDIGLFAHETADARDRAVLLESADRFLGLLGHPRGTTTAVAR